MTKLDNVRRRIILHFGTSAHIYRQISATFAAALLSVSGGITLGFTAVLLPQLEEDQSFEYDKSFDSWIASISPLAMLMGCLFAGTMSDGIGRKLSQILLILPFTIGWAIMGLSKNNSLMLIGRFITGVCTGAVRPNTIVYIGELTDPRYRAIALFIPSLAVHIGTLISHIVGKYVYWKTCCFLFTIPNILTLIILIFSRESPLWLLTKGKIDKGVESFRLFRGEGEAAQKELTTVLEKCKEKTRESSVKEILGLIFSKPFMKSLITIFLLFLAVQWCGVNALSFYAEDIFEKTFSGAIDAFLLMILTDCIRVAASTIGCVFAKNLPRTKTFVTSCFVTTIVLITLVVYLCLRPQGLVWLAVTCMVIYIGVASLLPSVSWSFVAEIFPSKVRGVGSGISSAISFGLLFSSVKAAPEIMLNYGESALFGSFAGVTLITGVIMMFILPETKGKSLQDIEDDLYKDKRNVKNNIDMVAITSKE